MSRVLDDATSAAHDAYDDAMPDDAMLDTMHDDAMLDTMPAMPDTALPLGAFLDAQIARVAARRDDTSETADTIEVERAILPARTSSPLPDMPDTRYVMEGEIAEDFLAYAQPSNEKDVEIEPADLDNPQPKTKRYDKNDFAARKHGKEREPWVQKPMPFPPKPSMKKYDQDFERFAEMIKPVFLQMRLTDMLKMSPHAKYMKDIVTNKRRIPEVEISTMLANYTFKGGTPKKLGRYTIMPSDIYAYWGLAQPQVPVPEPPVEYQTPVYQWELEELTEQWHP
ncbi:hypothetical protein ZWY2020_022156 [Hordeum vulgare]|nr:hypothetical protein ZWY2020_022156 [Hordeum vulgare]